MPEGEALAVFFPDGAQPPEADGDEAWDHEDQQELGERDADHGDEAGAMVQAKEIWPHSFDEPGLGSKRVAERADWRAGRNSRSSVAELMGRTRRVRPSGLTAIWKRSLARSFGRMAVKLGGVRTVREAMGPWN